MHASMGWCHMLHCCIYMVRWRQAWDCLLRCGLARRTCSGRTAESRVDKAHSAHTTGGCWSQHETPEGASITASRAAAQRPLAKPLHMCHNHADATLRVFCAVSTHSVLQQPKQCFAIASLLRKPPSSSQVQWLPHFCLVTSAAPNSARSLTTSCPATIRADSRT